MSSSLPFMLPPLEYDCAMSRPSSKSGMDTFQMIMVGLAVFVVLNMFLKEAPMYSHLQHIKSGTVAMLAPVTGEPAVEEVTGDEDLKKFVASHPNMSVIMFYATWCPHCTTMKPALDAFAKEHPEISCAKVDAETCDPSTFRGDKALLHLEHYPTITIVKKGKIMKCDSFEDAVEKIHDAPKEQEEPEALRNYF